MLILILLLSINTHMYYLNDKVESQSLISETRTIYYGIYHVEYYVEDCYPQNCIGFINNNKKTTINFFRNNILFMVKTNICMEPCIIIHGDGSYNDGLENDSTYFTILENGELNMYTMWNTLIRTVYFNDCHLIDFKRVNNNYGIFVSYNNLQRIGGLVNLNIFFDKNEDYIKTNNGYVHLPLDLIDDEQFVLAITCNEKGIVFFDMETNQIQDEIISYCNIFYDVYKLNFKYDNQIDKITEVLDNIIL